MYEPTSSINIPATVSTCCDAVASFYLHQRDVAVPKLFAKTPDAKFFQDRQDMIEHLKELVARDPGAKRTLDLWLWGKSPVTEVWTNGILATLRTDLAAVLVGTKTFSLQVLPRTLAGRGHHMALGRAAGGGDWWLLDPSSKLYFFASAGDLAGFTLLLLLDSPGFDFRNRTVLLEIG